MTGYNFTTFGNLRKSVSGPSVAQNHFAEKLANKKPFVTTPFKTKYANGNIATCRQLFADGFKNNPNYTRKEFVADCAANNIPKSTAGTQWWKLGGPTVLS